VFQEGISYPTQSNSQLYQATIGLGQMPRNKQNGPARDVDQLPWSRFVKVKPLEQRHTPKIEARRKADQGSPATGTTSPIYLAAADPATAQHTSWKCSLLTTRSGSWTVRTVKFPGLRRGTKKSRQYIGMAIYAELGLETDQ